jgi:2-polyprenyl-3-methyl-5-hydroxy-6-metoxy-1,4-benzoquinol methylase
MSKSTLEAELSDRHYATGEEFERSNKSFMRSLVPAEPHLRILDLGCGTGLNASHLAKLGHEIVGVDLSPVAIDKFRRRGFVGELCDIEAGPLPFPPESFDMVYASEVVEHCADTAKFLARIHKVLKPQGTLLLSTTNSAFWPFRLLALAGQTVSECQHPGHVRFFSKRGLKAAVEANGFEVTSVAGRHMYLVLGRAIGDVAASLLLKMRWKKEPRFSTQSYFWQWSHFASKASGFWADTLIIKARKRS